MAIKTRHYSNKFNRGEIDPLAIARDDVTKVASSGSLMENFMPLRLGPMTYRPGTEHLDESAGLARHLPFIAATDDTALVELTTTIMRIWVNDALITRTGVTTTFTNGSFNTDLSGWTDADGAASSSVWISGGALGLTGNESTSASRWQTLTTQTGAEHGFRITIQRAPVIVQIGTSGAGSYDIFNGELKPGTHCLAFTPGSNITVTLSNFKKYIALVLDVSFDSTGVLTLPTEYSLGQLDTIRYTQSADTMFLAAKDNKPMVIERRGIKSWSIVNYIFKDGPFNAINDTSTTIASSSFSGEVTLTASTDYFTSTDVGTLIKSVSSGQTVTAIVTAQNTGTNSIRVFGVGDSRVFNYGITGLTGTTTVITLQRSTDNATWSDFVTWTGVDRSSTVTDSQDNITYYYRLWCKTGDFSTGPVGLVLVYDKGAVEGVCRISQYVSPTSVFAQVITDFGGTAATRDWYRGTWSNTNNKYPTAVALYEGRLWWAGKNSSWGSVSDAYYSFDSSIEGASAAISLTIGFGPVDNVSWLMPLNRLLMGIASDELSIRSNSFGEVLSRTNANIRGGSSQGTAPIDPVKMNSRAFFVQRSKQKIYQLQYTIEQDIHDALDTTILNPSICSPGIKRIAITMQPETRLYVLLTDGSLRVYLIDQTEDVAAWSRVTLPAAIVWDITVLPGATEDEVYLQVIRPTGAYLEKFALFSESKGGTISKTFDGLVQYTSPGTTLTGLAHLEGLQVGVWADGQYRQNVTVSGGSVTVSASWTNVVAGLRYTADYITSKITRFVDYSVATYDKRVVNTGFILKDYWPGSLKVGPDSSTLEAFPTTEDGTTVVATATLSEYDEPPFPFNGTTESDPRIHLQANNPCTILAMTYGIEEHSDPTDPQGGRS